MTPTEPSTAESLPWEPGAGLQMLDGRILTFQPHPDCPCSDCRTAHRFGRFEGADDADE